MFSGHVFTFEEVYIEAVHKTGYWYSALLIGSCLFDITGHVINSSNSNNHTQCVFQMILSSTGIITYVTNRKHVTDYFLYYVMDCINTVCMFVLFSSP